MPAEAIATDNDLRLLMVTLFYHRLRLDVGSKVPICVVAAVELSLHIRP
jgi:hypothetical protein